MWVILIFCWHSFSCFLILTFVNCSMLRLCEHICDWEALSCSSHVTRIPINWIFFHAVWRLSELNVNIRSAVLEFLPRASGTLYCSTEPCTILLCQSCSSYITLVWQHFIKIILDTDFVASNFCVLCVCMVQRKTCLHSPPLCQPADLRGFSKNWSNVQAYLCISK